MREQWRDISGTGGAYEVSSFGVVRSKDRVVNGRRYKGRVLKGTKNKSGHIQVNMSGRRDYIHRLVLEAFVGLCPNGMECRHLNGEPQDNRLINLTWGTSLENSQDKARHGRTGYRHKLTESQVRAIRKERESGATQRSIARKYGVTLRCVQLILLGKTWLWVK